MGIGRKDEREGGGGSGSGSGSGSVLRNTPWGFR